MTWLQRYNVRHFTINSIWIFPVIGILAALAAVPLLHEFEEALGWESSANPEAVRVVLGTLAGSMFTFIVFVSSALLISVQLASAQLTPRIIAIVFRDPVTKFSLTIFVFIFTFSLAALVRVNASVPLLTTKLAAYGSLASLGIFLFLIDHIGKALRPSGALRAAALLGPQSHRKRLSEAVVRSGRSRQGNGRKHRRRARLDRFEQQGRRDSGFRHPGTRRDGGARRLRHRNGPAASATSSRSAIHCFASIAETPH